MWHVGAVRVVVASVLLAMAGCSSDEPEFPAGAWALANPESVVVVEFRPDGTLAGGEGKPGQDPATVPVEPLQFEAQWSATTEQLTLTGPWCGAEVQTAVYRWMLDGDTLSLAVVEDACAEQRKTLDGAVLARVASPATPSAAPSGSPVAAPVPWWNDEVFYEVFVRSFSDSDGNGVGDLQGLIDKLGYLDDLGVTALWLMPIAQSPSYHGYDTTDYYTVEEDYGTNQDFKALVAAAHDRDIEVIVDLVLNHTSSEHPWFGESASGPDSGKRDWYVWSDTDTGEKTEWGAPVWHPRDGAYYFGLFWEGMPDLNYRNPEVTEQMYDVARFWLQEMDADGFRLDAVRHLIEEDGNFAGTQATHDWLVGWDDFLDGVDPQSLTVGEVWDDTSVVAPYVTADEVDLTFEFSLAEQLLRSVNSGDPAPFASQLADVLRSYPPGQFAPFLTNHDQDRVMSQLGDGPEGVAKAKLAASALLTLPGVPFLYYGEEIGMVGVKPDEMIRTPMQWNASKNAGFTTGTPWEPVNDDYTSVNVAAQQGDQDSLLRHYQRLLTVRRDHPALSIGALQALQSSCPGVIAALRTTPDSADTVLVMLNFNATEATGCTVSAPSSELPEGTRQATELLTGKPASAVTVGPDGALEAAQPLPTVGPRQAAILHLTTTR
jgi:alpha-amylase